MNIWENKNLSYDQAVAYAQIVQAVNGLSVKDIESLAHQLMEDARNHSTTNFS